MHAKLLMSDLHLVTVCILPLAKMGSQVCSIWREEEARRGLCEGGVLASTSLPLGRPAPSLAAADPGGAAAYGNLSQRRRDELTAIAQARLSAAMVLMRRRRK